MAKGSVRHRSGNKWQLEVDFGIKIDPKTRKKKRHRKYKTITAKGKRDAEKQPTRFVSEVTADNYFEPKEMMFVDFVQNVYLSKYAEKHLSNTTLSSYKRLLRLRILPAFQQLRLDQVQTMHIIDFIANISEEGMRQDKKGGKLSPGSVFYHYRILRSIFNFAVACKLLKESPMIGVEKPKVKQKEINVFDEEQTTKLMQCLEKEPLRWQVFIKLAISTGLRRFELLALELRDFDLDESTISVRQGLTYTKETGFKIGNLKNPGSERKVSIPEVLGTSIKKLKMIKQEERMATAELWNGGNYFLIFSDWQGKPLHPSSVNTWWRRFIKRHNLDYINPHALRHTSATLLINKGVHAKTISSRLGHADIKTTMNIYGHALESADKAAADTFDDVLSSKLSN